MPDLAVINHMIKDTSKVPLEQHYEKFFVKLTEPQAPDSSVTISGLPSDAVVIKVDSFKSPDTIFNGSKGECKRADYVIVSQKGKKKRILFIEMKRKKASFKEMVEQLTGAACFIRYCQDIGRSFWGQQDFLNGYQYRFVCLRHTTINKRTTKIEKPKGHHDSPEKAMKIDYPGRLQFNHLIGA